MSAGAEKVPGHSLVFVAQAVLSVLPEMNFSNLESSWRGISCGILGPRAFAKMHLLKSYGKVIGTLLDAFDCFPSMCVHVRSNPVYPANRENIQNLSLKLLRWAYLSSWAKPSLEETFHTKSESSWERFRVCSCGTPMPTLFFWPWRISWRSCAKLQSWKSENQFLSFRRRIFAVAILGIHTYLKSLRLTQELRFATPYHESKYQRSWSQRTSWSCISPHQSWSIVTVISLLQPFSTFITIFIEEAQL